MQGLLGQKIGMTSIFLENGQNVPVTIIKVIPNVVTNVLTNKKNGYNALQLAAFDKPEKRTSKPLLFHLKKSKTTGKYFIKEIKNMIGFSLGDKIDSSIFKVGTFVDVSGISKGKGFAGTIKRHNQSIGPKSHGGGGGSKPVRLTGSLGDVSSNRVFKGQTMPGHMGNVKRTIQNLQIVFIDVANNFILVKGAIPGSKKGFVVVKNAIKQIKSKTLLNVVDFSKKNIKNDLLQNKENVSNENVVNDKSSNVENVNLDKKKTDQSLDKDKNDSQIEKNDILQNKKNVSNKKSSNVENVNLDKKKTDQFLNKDKTNSQIEKNDIPNLNKIKDQKEESK